MAVVSFPASHWPGANPVLASGEVGIDTTTGQFKVGDGVTAWASLAFVGTTVSMSNDVVVLNGGASPTDGTSGTGAAVAGPGSLYIDTAGKNAYINANTKASPTWKLITRAA